MSFEPPQKKQKISPIIEAKSLLSKGDDARAFAVLKEAAENGDIMACFDCGFMMIQGIGCENRWKTREEGIKLIEKGMDLEKGSNSLSWKSDGSVSELFEPQLMLLGRLFFIGKMVI